MDIQECFLVSFIIFVGIFEYIFFVYIVNKFKIANSKTIFCNIYKNTKCIAYDGTIPGINISNQNITFVKKNIKRTIFDIRSHFFNQPELGTFEWWIWGLMVDLLFFLILRLNNACFPLVIKLQIN